MWWSTCRPVDEVEDATPERERLAESLLDAEGRSGRAGEAPDRVGPDDPAGVGFERVDAPAVPRQRPRDDPPPASDVEGAAPPRGEEKARRRPFRARKEPGRGAFEGVVEVALAREAFVPGLAAEPERNVSSQDRGDSGSIERSRELVVRLERVGRSIWFK